MDSLLTRKALGMAVAAGLLSACAAAANGGVPSASSATQAASSRTTTDAKALRLSGQYTGSVTDSVHGTGKATLMLSQSKSALGGAMKIAGNPIDAYVSWNASGNAVDGTSVFVGASGYCTFSHTGTYDLKTLTLSGSYKTTYGCSGETGTYKLKHKCYFRGTGTNADVRPDIGPKGC